MSRTNNYDARLDIAPTSEPKNALLTTEVMNSLLLPALAYATSQIKDWRAGVVGGSAAWTQTIGTYLFHSFNGSLWRTNERGSVLKNALYITAVNAYCGALNGALMETSDVCFRKGNWNAEVSILDVCIAAAEGAVTQGVTAGTAYLCYENKELIKDVVMKGAAQLISKLSFRKNNNQTQSSNLSNNNDDSLDTVSSDFNRQSLMVTQSDLTNYFNTL